MCGIVGFATSYKTGFVSTEMDAFYNMLYFDALRGMDSTGVFGVDAVGNVQVHKEASHALDFMQKKELHDFKKDSVFSGKVVVGHNRAATRGEIKDENAHPFIIEDRIVLVQNGTWFGDHKSVKNTEVDTEALAHIIYENVDDIPKAFEKINAAYALCWYDVVNKTIHLTRNKERPLFLAKTKNGAYAWCSEPGFLRVALARNGIEVEKLELLPEKKLFTFAIEDRAFVQKPEVDLPSFRFTSSPTHRQWPYAGEEPDEKIYPLKPINNTKPVSQRSVNNVGDDWVEFDFFAAVCKKIPECVISPGEADEIMPRLQELVSSKQPVELMDYAPANSRATCKAWHVYGHLVLPDDNDTLAAVVVHWFVFNKTEQEIMDYTANAFYHVTINHMRKHVVGPEQRMLTSIVNNAIPVPLLNTHAIQ